MYQNYWGLREKPFELTPDQKFVYYSREHEEALLRLCYTVKDLKGAMLLTGHYGCGKTILSRVFLNEIMGSKYEVALITNPSFNAHELLEEIVYQLGGGRQDGQSKVQLLRALHDIIYSNLMAKKETVLLIDEAQAITDLQAFEELRLLLNFQQNNRFLLTLILIGHMDLLERLNKLPQLKQRLVLNYHLNPLSEIDTMRYIDHRLNVAGAQTHIFTPEAKKIVYHFSSGVPRIINGICDMALLLGFDESKEMIDEDLMNIVVTQQSKELAWSV